MDFRGLLEGVPMAVDDRDELRPGLLVRSAEGVRVGRVAQVDGEHLVVERGRLLPRRLVLSRAQVGRIQQGEVHLQPVPEQRPARGMEEEAGADAGARGPVHPPQVRLPLVHEEVDPVLHLREQGAVRVHKVVRVEERHLTVQVRREELVVERLPVDPSGAARGAGGPFEEDTRVFTLWEEEVEVVKRPVPYQEVRVTKGVHRHCWAERVPVRYEVAHVEEEGEVEYVPLPPTP
jgi:uncharacterized protein (TIGR02271 family)